MFVPLGDSPNLPKTPWVTLALITINVAIHLLLLPADFRAADPRDPALRAYTEILAQERGAPPQQLQLSQGALIRFEHGVVPRSFELGDAVTSMFLHGGWMHLLGNMLFLWIFGDNVEHRMGRLGFLVAYLGTGLVATLGDVALRWGSGIPSVGASGAISGILGFYFLFFPHNRVRVWVFLFPFFMNVIELSARFVLGFYLVVDNLLPLLLGGQGGVAHGAHIGGFLAGWGAATWLGESGRPRPRRARVAAPADRSDPRARFRSALADGRLQEAARWLLGAPRSLGRTQLSADDKIELGEALERSGEARLALAAYQRALADHPRGPGRPRAHLGAARVLLHELGSPTAAYQHLYATLEEEPSPEEREVARTMLGELRQATAHLPENLSG